MEEKRGRFILIWAETIREFVARLNEKGLTREDIVYIDSPKGETYYAIVYV